LTRLLAPVLVAAAILSASACRKPAAASATATTPAGQAAPAAQAPGTSPAAPAPVKPMPAELPDVLARVNGEAVMKAELDRLIKNMEASANQQVPAERRDEIFRTALDQLVTYTVLSQETRARNVTVTDAELDGNLKQMQGQFPSEQEFRKALAARGMTIEKLRADARMNIGISKMMDAEVSGQPPPTDAQVREFYDKNPDKFKQTEAVRASHILFKVDEKADEATKKKRLAEAQAVMKQVRGGADFAALAKKHSSDGSAAQGGDLNFFTKGQMVPAFDAAAFALQPGQISDIVTTEFGYHIIKVTERRPPSTVPFEQVSERIKEYLAEQRKQERAQAFIESLKQKAKIEVLV
jgi:peptidyl-prolyl cis-trans isomerase C